MQGTGVMQGAEARPPWAHRRLARGVGPLLVLSAVTGSVLTGCGLHVTKNGVSGDILGHSFSADRGALPAGFPSDVPTPDHARVLGGGGTDNRWDAAFALNGGVTSGTEAYEDKFRSAGFIITNAEIGTVPTPSSTAAATGSTSTTVTVEGSVFTASTSQWTVAVVGGSTTAPTTGTLKPGEFAVNITVVPTSSIATSTTAG